MIKEINDSIIKQSITRLILDDLPEYFGLDDAKEDYINQVKDEMFYAVIMHSNPIAFISIKSHFSCSAEISVMGVLKAYHHQGYGRALIEYVEPRLLDEGIKYLQVKTLASTHPDKHYALTRKFYEQMGFDPLEIFETLWDEENPCLLYVKGLKQ